MGSPILTLLFVSTFCISGVCHTLWLKSSWFKKCAYPIDFGCHINNKRIFGANKTWAAFIILLPVNTLNFYLVGLYLVQYHHHLLLATNWPNTAWMWGQLGLLTALGFLLAELPNSFVKRQCNIQPGGSPKHPLFKSLAFGIDQFDSVIGVLIFMQLIMPTTWKFNMLICALGTLIHWLFNVLLYFMGIKNRAA